MLTASGLPAAIAETAKLSRPYVKQLRKLHAEIGTRISEMEELLARQAPAPARKVNGHTARPMFVTFERERKAPPTEPALASRRVVVRRDKKAVEHTLALIAERGEHGVTVQMVSRVFRITRQAAAKRLWVLVRTGLVEGPIGAHRYYRGVRARASTGGNSNGHA